MLNTETVLELEISSMRAIYCLCCSEHLLYIFPALWPGRISAVTGLSLSAEKSFQVQWWDTDQNLESKQDLRASTTNFCIWKWRGNEFCVVSFQFQIVVINNEKIAIIVMKDSSKSF